MGPRVRVGSGLQNDVKYIILSPTQAQKFRKLGTGEWINQNHPEITLLKGDGNLWWSGGVNMGAKYVLERKDTDYLLLWNNDILPESVYFTQLDDLIHEFSDDMIVGSKIL